MGWGSFIAVMATAFVLLSIPVGAAVDGWTNARCLNSTHLYLWDDIGMSGRWLQANTTIDCTPYECNNYTESCNQPYQMSVVQSDFTLFTFFFMFISGITTLYFGAAKKKKHVLLTIWSTIMFSILSLQSVALDAVFTGTFFAAFTTIFIGINMLLMIVSLIVTFIGVIKMLHGLGGEDGIKDKVQHGSS
jgi:hypothetical protein